MNWRAAVSITGLWVTMLGIGLGLQPAAASDCARDLYDHNGSLMEIEFCDGGSVVI